jgi:predicted Zn finger-like uncharacterized protein
MLIVCPNCATFCPVDSAALGPSERRVRCAHCKVTWFAGGPAAAPERSEFESINDVIAGAEMQTARGSLDLSPHPAADARMPRNLASAAGGNFSTEPGVPIGEVKAELEFADSATELLPPRPLQATVIDAPTLVPSVEHEKVPDAVVDERGNEDVESYTARRQRLAARRREKRRSSRWTAIVLVLFAVNVALISGREEVVRALPQTASFFAATGLPVNLRHLKFENVKISKVAQDGVDVLIVQGAIVSTADRPITVPRLRFAARDAAGQEIYTWTVLPSRSILDPGERLEFSSRLASPPAGARTVMVRFSNAQDSAGAGAE